MQYMVPLGSEFILAESFYLLLFPIFPFKYRFLTNTRYTSTSDNAIPLDSRLILSKSLTSFIFLPFIALYTLILISHVRLFNTSRLSIYFTRIVLLFFLFHFPSLFYIVSYTVPFMIFNQHTLHVHVW